MKIGGLINTRLTGVWGWNQVTRHSASGNITDPDAMLFGLFSEIDVRATTLELDAVLVTGSDTTGNGLHVAVGDTRRIGQYSNTLRVMVDRDVPGPADFTGRVIRDAGLPLDRCEKVRPSLEDVFVAATQARKAARDMAV